MYGEIDLETYTLSIIRLNTAFEKLNSQENIDVTKELFTQSFNDLKKIYEDIVEDLNQNEVNLNEYYLFFNNGKQTFPQYIEVLGTVKRDELQEVVNSLLNVFTNLNRIAEGFGGNDLNEF